MLKKAFTVLVITLSVLPGSKGDIWDSPKVKSYFSENRDYMLVVTPTIIPEKYQLWEYYKNTKMPESTFEQAKRKKFFKNLSAEDTLIRYCKGQLYYISHTDTTLIWERKLLNSFCPVTAIVADNGSSIVTFDNWYSAGYGNNLMVVYNNKGDALKTYDLDDISPFPLNDYSTTISSIWWNSGARFLDLERIEISFINDQNIINKRIYNTRTYTFEI
jgi:hypothetical protein